MPTEQGHNIGKLSGLIHGDNSKGASTASFPIDGNVLWVGLATGMSASITNGARGATRGSIREGKLCLTLTKLVSQALRLIRRLS
jgi:hypothetical protein